MSGYRVGDRVDITIKGARVEHVGGGMPGLGPVIHALYVDPLGDQRVVEIAVNAESVDIDRTPPPGWPPRSRDVWIDRDDDPWIGLGRDLAQAIDDRTPVDPAVVHARYGPLRLVHRVGGEPS